MRAHERSSGIECTGRCPVCRQEIHSAPVVCTSCGTNHHAECWRYSRGCSIFGCGQTAARAAAPGSVERLDVGDAYGAAWQEPNGLARRLALTFAGLLVAVMVLCGAEAGGHAGTIEARRPSQFSQEEIERIVREVAVRNTLSPVDPALARIVAQHLDNDLARRMLAAMSRESFVEQGRRPGRL